jgi:hypothetical protein
MLSDYIKTLYAFYFCLWRMQMKPRKGNARSSNSHNLIHAKKLGLDIPIGNTDMWLDIKHTSI